MGYPIATLSCYHGKHESKISVPFLSNKPTEAELSCGCSVAFVLCITMLLQSANNLKRSLNRLNSKRLLSLREKRLIKELGKREVSAIPLQQSVADLEAAFKNFFDACKGKRKGQKVGYPKFKKRTSSQSARLTRGGFSVKGQGVYLAKMGIVKPIWSRELPSEPSSVTIIKDCANRYFLSFVVEVEPVQLDAKNQSVGIDLGIKTFAVMSNGEKAVSPCYKALDRKVRQLQRKLARQHKDSKRRSKTRIQLAKQHNKIAETRKDFLHKLSTKVVSENQTIVLEDLNVSGMVKNRKLSRAISQQGWREFRVLVEAKSEKYGREFVIISRWEPTVRFVD